MRSKAKTSDFLTTKKPWKKTGKQGGKGTNLVKSYESQSADAHLFDNNVAPGVLLQSEVDLQRVLDRKKLQRQLRKVHHQLNAC